jgi:hypothetical protein
MRLRLKAALPLVFAAGVVIAVFSGSARASEGEELTIHNNTGHSVVVFLLQNDAPDLDPDDGVQVAAIANGKSAVAHVPHCHFAVLLVDHEDLWHAEFHDCSSTDYTFTKDTGHAKREHHHH